jgi:hypothetical protein
LDPLLKIVGASRFVLLGEATHGTHEFYRLRAQITKRLIKEKGFSAVAVEGDWPDAYRRTSHMASPWQQQAIREVTPMVEELGSYITMTIYHLGEDPDRLIFTSFREYVAANAGLDSDIAQLISDYVEYDKAKQAVEELSFEIELPRS